MNINLTVNIRDLLECLRFNSNEENLELIKQIDLMIADAGFTEELAKWALNEAVKEYKHDPEILEIGVDAYVLGLLDKS